MTDEKTQLVSGAPVPEDHCGSGVRMTVHRMRLRNGVRVSGYDSQGQYETEPTYSEYVLVSDYDALAARLAEAIATLQSIASNSCCSGCNEAALVARAFLRPADSAPAALVHHDCLPFPGNCEACVAEIEAKDSADPVPCGICGGSGTVMGGCHGWTPTPCLCQSATSGADECPRCHQRRRDCECPSSHGTTQTAAPASSGDAAKSWMGIKDPYEKGLANRPSATADVRPCTCHPDDNPPVPCPRKYALTECRAAATLAASQEKP